MKKRKNILTFPYLLYSWKSTELAVPKKTIPKEINKVSKKRKKK